MINLIKVFNFHFLHLKPVHSLQKIFSHAKVAEASASPVTDWIASLWNTLLVRGLGLIPIRDTTHADDQHVSSAFEILRVSLSQTFTLHD
jgi:hypothetical protein